MDQPVRQLAVTIPRYTCQKCLWAWSPRVENPKVCPRCRTAAWREPKKEK